MNCSLSVVPLSAGKWGFKPANRLGICEPRNSRLHECTKQFIQEFTVNHPKFCKPKFTHDLTVSMTVFIGGI